MVYPNSLQVFFQLTGEVTNDPVSIEILFFQNYFLVVNGVVEVTVDAVLNVNTVGISIG